MYPEDIEALYPQVKVGTPVTIVNKPVKIGWWGEELYMEVHPALEEHDQGFEWLRTLALDRLEAITVDRDVRLSGRDFLRVLSERNAMPARISASGREPELADSNNPCPR